jgi:predicted RNA-binding Zn-ribbon protein involved in translation (DUF1610 family)
LTEYKFGWQDNRWHVEPHEAAGLVRARLALPGSESHAGGVRAVPLGETSRIAHRPSGSISGPPGSPRILLIDTEVAPALVMMWDIWNPKINPHEHIIQDKRMICFGAKWLNNGPVVAYSEYHHGRARMLDELWRLLDEADAVEYYNGNRFDDPVMNTEFLKRGDNPPSPYKKVDYYQLVKRKFHFLSNSMDYVSKTLSLDGKSGTRPDWKLIMENDPHAWDDLIVYQKQDVQALEDMRNELGPWLHGGFSHAVYSGQFSCPKCGSDAVIKKGFAYTTVSAYQRYRCNNCGGWSRDNFKVKGTTIREVQ